MCAKFSHSNPNRLNIKKLLRVFLICCIVFVSLLEETNAFPFQRDDDKNIYRSWNILYIKNATTGSQNGQITRNHTNPVASEINKRNENKTKRLSNQNSYDDLWSKKAAAVLFIVCAGVVIGLVINFVNLHTDFMDIQDFYRGYSGRKMHIAEGKLTSREYLRAIKILVESESEKTSDETSSTPIEDKLTVIDESTYEEKLKEIQENYRKAHPHSHSNFSAYSSIFPLKNAERAGGINHLRWLHLHLPLYASSYIEDQDPEWRELDYSLDIGIPPSDFWEFIRQYDWRIYFWDKEKLGERYRNHFESYHETF